MDTKIWKRCNIFQYSMIRDPRFTATCMAAIKPVHITYLLKETTVNSVHTVQILISATYPPLRYVTATLQFA